MAGESYLFVGDEACAQMATVDNGRTNHQDVAEWPNLRFVLRCSSD
jgi:hypothetical protein